MNESILTSIKKLVNVAENDNSFDSDLIMYINSVFMVIMQEWYGVEHSFKIEDESATWEDFLGTDEVDYEGLKTYIGLRVRLLFDPPTNSAVLQAIKDEMKDLEWRMYIWKDMLRLDNIGKD